MGCIQGSLWVSLSSVCGSVLWEGLSCVSMVGSLSLGMGMDPAELTPEAEPSLQGSSGRVCWVRGQCQAWCAPGDNSRLIPSFPTASHPSVGKEHPGWSLDPLPAPSYELKHNPNPSVPTGSATSVLGSLPVPVRQPGLGRTEEEQQQQRNNNKTTK